MDKYVSLVIALVFVAGCSSSSNKDTEESMVEPGTSRIPIESVAIHNNGNDLGGRPTGLCDLTTPSFTLAIIEGTDADKVKIPVSCDSSSRYSHSARIFQATTLAVIAGSPVPEALTYSWLIDFMAGEHGPPSEGETMLVGLKQLRGEWFLLESMPIDISLEEFAFPYESDVVPLTFEELIDRSNSFRDNHQQECPYKEGVRNISDEQWEEKIFEDRPASCNPPGEPDAGHNTDEEVRDPEECTDMNPCD